MQAIATVAGRMLKLDGKIPSPKTLDVLAIRQREIGLGLNHNLPYCWLGSQCPKTLCELLGENCHQQLWTPHASVPRCAYWCKSGTIVIGAVWVGFKPTLEIEDSHLVP